LLDNSLELIGDLHLLLSIASAMARSPSGKAEDCKSSIVGSIPTRASTFKKKPLFIMNKGFLLDLGKAAYGHQQGISLMLIEPNKRTIISHLVA
jgi:hypothetical protein